MYNRKHKRLVSSHRLSEWRYDNSKKILDLHGVKFVNKLLTNMDLQGTNFVGADLRNTSFFRSDLRGADLRYANLEGARLNSTNLLGAKVNKQTKGILCIDETKPLNMRFKWKMLLTHMNFEDDWYLVKPKKNYFIIMEQLCYVWDYYMRIQLNLKMLDTGLEI